MPPVDFAALTKNGHDPATLDVDQTIHTHVAETDAAARPAMSLYYEARKSVRPRGYDELDQGRMLMVGAPAVPITGTYSAGLRSGGRLRQRYRLHMPRSEQQ